MAMASTDKPMVVSAVADGTKESAATGLMREITRLIKTDDDKTFLDQ